MEQSCQAVVNENARSPSKTSLTMSEDCEEMRPSEKTEESLAPERKAEAFALWLEERTREHLLRALPGSEERIREQFLRALSDLEERIREQFLRALFDLEERKREQFYRALFGSEERIRERFLRALSVESFRRFPSEAYSDEVRKEALCFENIKPFWGSLPRNSWSHGYEYEPDLKKCFNLVRICLSSKDPLVEQSCQVVVNENWHKFNMTEGEYNLWKDMPEELKDVLIQIIPAKANVVRRLRFEARKGKAKAKAALRASQELKTGGGSSTVNYAPESSDIEAGTSSTQADDEHVVHTNPETGGSSSTAQNEPPPSHRGLPVGGDHQVRNVQVNGPMNQTVNYAPESSDIEASTSSTQADDEHAEHTNPEIGGSSSTAQNEPPPNHRGLPVVGDHQVRNVQVNGPMNQTVNYAPESSDIEAGTSSTQADDDPAEHTNLETRGGSPTTQNEPHTNPETGGGSPTAQNGSHTNPETGGGSPTTQNERQPNHQGLPVGGEPAPPRRQYETIFTFIGECVSFVLAVKWDKKSADGMTTIEKFFWDSLVGCIIVGIISLCYGFCLSGGDGRGRRSMVARVVNAVSYVATGLAVVTAGGLQFHNPKMVVWLIPLFWVIIVPAIVGYAWKQR